MKGLLLVQFLINVVHKEAPGGEIAFSTGANDPTDAVARWLKPSA